MTWQQEFERLDIMNCDCEHCVETSKEDIVRFITNLLEEQRKEVLDEVKIKMFIIAEQDYDSDSEMMKKDISTIIESLKIK